MDRIRDARSLWSIAERSNPWRVRLSFFPLVFGIRSRRAISTAVVMSKLEILRQLLMRPSVLDDSRDAKLSSLTVSKPYPHVLT